MKKVSNSRTAEKEKKKQALYDAIPPVLMICAVMCGFWCFWPCIINILGSVSNAISILIGTIGVILSGFAVFYGRKAYRVAQDIFQEGIQMNNKKVLEQAGWEFVSELFIPLSRLESDTRKYHEENVDTEKSIKDFSVEDLYNDIKRTKLPDRFSYWETHKGDILDSLTVCEGLDDTKEKFKQIREFVEEAIKYTSYVNRVLDILKRNQTYETVQGKRINMTLEQFLRMQEIDKKTMNGFWESMNEIINSRSIFPKEFNIDDTMELMKNNTNESV